MKQLSPWGQFWFDLSSLHRVRGCAIFTPLCTHIKHPAHRGRYYSTWFRMTPIGAVYYAVDGNTMIEMLIDGLRKTDSFSIEMKIRLLAICAEDLTRLLERRA